MSSSVLINTRSRNEENIPQSFKLPNGQENMGKPLQTPRKALGSLKNSAQSLSYSARKPQLGAVHGGTFKSTTKPSRNHRQEAASKTLNTGPPLTEDSECDTEPEFIPEPSKEKHDIYHPPSFLHALKTFRPVPLLPYSHGAAGIKSSLVLEEMQALPYEPRRPRSKQDNWSFLDLQPSLSEVEPNLEVDLPDLSDLDELLANLS